MKKQRIFEFAELRGTFEDLLYYESSLISSYRLDEWTELLHDDVRYWIPIRSNKEIGAEDLHRAHLQCHLDDDKQTLILRAHRASRGFGYAENPAPRVRHFVTNVRVLAVANGEVHVTSNVLLWRSQVGSPDHELIGCRNDRWKEDDENWLLIERQVVLDKDVVPALGVLL